MKRNLFAYGTLMCEDIFCSVAACTAPSAAARLKDYRRCRVRGEHYPGLVSSRGDRVEGLLYRGIETAAWKRLDRFEGGMYERKRIQVELGDGTAADAETYLVRRGCEYRLDVAEWDFADFIENRMQRFIREYAGYAGVDAEQD